MKFYWRAPPLIRNASFSDLPLLTEAEREQLLVEWNDTRTEYPRDACIHELFEEQAKKRPDTIALVLEEHHLTYGELNTRANQLAHRLRRLGVVPETFRLGSALSVPLI